MKTETIKSLLYSTIHRNKKTITELAEDLGISENYLYRTALPLDASGVKFPLEYLIPLMNAARNYSILDHLAKRCGFLLVKVPLASSKIDDEISYLGTYQESTIAAVKAVKEFFTKPDKTTFENADKALHEVMVKSAALQKFNKKKIDGQFEMEF